MGLEKGRRPLSLTYALASFFGALMVAGAFAYYNYKFSQYKFFNFNEFTFYTKNDTFTPKEEKYTILVYSSNMHDAKKLVKKLKIENTILAIDLYQKRFKEENSTIYLTSGMNTLLKFIQRYNIYEIPCAFEIKRDKKKIYKQNSMVEIIR